MTKAKSGQACGPEGPQCTDIAQGDLLVAYVAGELKKRARDRFEIHVLECAFCAAEVEPVAQVVHAVQAFVTARAPDASRAPGMLAAAKTAIVYALSRVQYQGLMPSSVNVPLSRGPKRKRDRVVREAIRGPNGEPLELELELVAKASKLRVRAFRGDGKPATGKLEVVWPDGTRSEARRLVRGVAEFDLGGSK